MCLSEFLSPQRLVIGIKDFDPIDNGIRVKQIGKNSPAENAGLKVGDIITKVNGKSITHPIRKSQGQIFIVHNFVLAKEGISKTSGQSLHIAQPLIFCKDIFY
ncbi:MAG: PDZ domain-containing protein [Nitrospirae bacterium]|nr:PDZ domain-containing protein [Nitrospirota bacterium]